MARRKRRALKISTGATVNSGASPRTFLHQHSVRHASTAKASFRKYYNRNT